MTFSNDYSLENLKRILGDNLVTVLDVGARGTPGASFAVLCDRVNLVAFEPHQPEFVRLSERLPDEGWPTVRSR